MSEDIAYILKLLDELAFSFDTDIFFALYLPTVSLYSSLMIQSIVGRLFDISLCYHTKTIN